MADEHFADGVEPVPTVPLYLGGTGSERDAFLKRIADLKPLDEQGGRAIVADVVKAGFSDLAIETLIKPLAEALGVSIPAARKFWKDAASAAREAAATQTVRASDEHRARIEQDAVEQRLAAAADERDRLWSSCREIAESPTLLADMEKLVHELGVVGEGASIRGAYLAASSRLCRHGALCLLRRGAPAGGKNFLVFKTLRLIPDNAVVHMSSGSPLSLVYYGDGDEDAFKHKVIYIPEAAILAERNGVESPLTFMLRTLISEGRLDHHVVMTQASGPPVSTHVKRNGPVVVIITTARDNVEDELLTRLVMSDADETGRQTQAVLAGVLAKDARRVDEEEIERWLDFQRWLEIAAPYDVVIPFRPAILEAFNELWDEIRTVPLRIRRDVNALVLAIQTSAILHKAQRERDAAGRILATLDDYRHAHEAFDSGLASLYRTKVPDTALAVVRAAEAMGATAEIGVKITVSALMGKLGITGRGVANSRLNHAEECGFLKLVDTGKGGARTYELGKTSAEVAALIESGGAGQGVFPTVEEVLKIVQKKQAANPSVPLRYGGTNGTRDVSVPLVPPYLSGTEASEKRFASEKPKNQDNPSGGKNPNDGNRTRI
jgi:hypothetical protein